MIITCPECSTRFRVDDNKIPAQGAKIRCARCKHVFAVSPRPEPEPLLEEIPAQQESPAGEEPVEDSTQASDFGFDDFDTPEIGVGTNDEFEPSAFENSDFATATDDFAFGDDYGNVSLAGGDDSEEEDDFSFGEPTPTTDTSATVPAQEAQKEFSFQTDSAPPPVDPLASSFNEDPTLDEGNPPFGEEFAFPKEAAPEAAPAAKSKSRSPLSVVILFVLVLILAILIAGGVLVWQRGPEGIENLISNLTGRPQSLESAGTIRLTDLQGSFITNRKEGEIFVIRGVAINDHREARAAIQVKGIIFDKGGKQILQKTIFCGNPISDADLRKLPYSKMEEMMGNQFGESLANLNVTPGQSIPFTIVFRKLPKTLAEFIVEVADSKPAAQ